MLSPTLFSLFCVLFLCLPLAVIFTIQREFCFRSLYVFSHTSQNISNASPSPQVVQIRDDEPFLRLASQKVTQMIREDKAKSNYPNQSLGSTQKLAFMFLTTSPLPFAPLWETFFNGTSKDRYNIYIHADPTRDYKTPFSGVFLNRVIPSKPSIRLTPTLAAAARRLLKHALKDDQLNHMFALISPSCIPIHSFDFIYTTLISSPKSFIEILKDEPWQYDRWSARGEDAMLPEVKLEECRLGSQFWVLKRDHARLVVRDQRIWKKFNVPCVRVNSCFTEENYFPTLVNMFDPRGCVPATLTHVDWSVNAGGHPKMYEAEEVVFELIVRLRKMRPRYGEDGINGSDWSMVKRNDPFLFARKFSPEALEPLLDMARTVLFNDSVGGFVNGSLIAS